MEQLFTHFAACANGNFLFFPAWYKYVQDPRTCGAAITNINDVWLIVAAVLEIMLRVAALAAIGYIIFAGFQYITSQGEPDKAARARSTAINALVGLVIAILATAVINFVAGAVH